MAARTGDHLDQDVLGHDLAHSHRPLVVHLRADPDRSDRDCYGGNIPSTQSVSGHSLMGARGVVVVTVPDVVNRRQVG